MPAKTPKPDAGSQEPPRGIESALGDNPLSLRALVKATAVRHDQPDTDQTDTKEQGPAMYPKRVRKSRADHSRYASVVSVRLDPEEDDWVNRQIYDIIISCHVSNAVTRSEFIRICLYIARQFITTANIRLADLLKGHIIDEDTDVAKVITDGLSRILKTRLKTKEGN